ncbi:MAG: hypothetical protein HC918_06110 [Oscillatoriales cyanobacterium SM2_1_8]|nr:hypothetical protein [Oscillatoriales cyanobacterium SM2_1_8]
MIGALLPLGCGDNHLVQCRQLIETVAPAAALTLADATPTPAPANSQANSSPDPNVPANSSSDSTPTENSANSTAADNSEVNPQGNPNGNPESNPTAVADRLEALALGVRGLPLRDRTLKDFQTRFDTYFTDSSRLLRDFAQARSNATPQILERLRQQAEDLQAREATLIEETNRYCAQ